MAKAKRVSRDGGIVGRTTDGTAPVTETDATDGNPSAGGVEAGGGTAKPKPKPKPRRAKGTGSLYLKRGVWYARWTHNGITHAESTGIRAEDEDAETRARDFLMDRTEPLRLRRDEQGLELVERQLQKKRERLEAAIRRVREAQSVSELYASFSGSPRRPDCSAGQLKRYAGFLELLADKIGGTTPVNEIRDGTAEVFARKISGSFAAGTYNKIINCLDLVWRTVVEGHNPWEGIVRKRGAATASRRPLTEAETDKLLDETDGELRVLVAVGLFTGLRLGDAVNLRWESVRDGAIFVKTRKTGKPVGIPIHPQLADALGGGRRSDSPFVMPKLAAEYAKGRDRTSIRVKRAMEAAGIETSAKSKTGRMVPVCGYHSLRHSFVSRAIAAGVPPHVVQAVVGHSSLAMTEHYDHLESDTVLEAFARMK